MGPLVEGGFFQFRDLVLELQFAPLELGQDESVGSRVALGVLNFPLEVAMTALKFGKLRFGGHHHSASVSAYDDSVTRKVCHQHRVESTRTPGSRPRH